jgi:hypothetical protein
VPEGLLFRGKYCGKSRLKNKINDNDSNGLNSVKPIENNLKQNFKIAHQRRNQAKIFHSK